MIDSRYQPHGAETCLTVLAWGGSVVLSGFLLKSGWLWFIVPFGAPAIGFWHALALRYLIAKGASWHANEPVPQTETEYYHRMAWWVMYPALGWGMLFLFAELGGLR